MPDESSIPDNESSIPDNESSIPDNESSIPDNAPAPEPKPVDYLNLDLLKEAQSGQGLVIGSRFPVKAQTRPPRQKFFQVHPDPAYTVDNIYVIEYEGEFYYVAPIPELISHVEAYIKQYRLHTAVTKNGTVFLWLCVLPTDNPLQRAWALSRLGVAEDAMKDWVRPQADQEATGYRTEFAPGNLGTPKWPSLTLQELVHKAFKDKLITHTDHAVIRELDGRQ